MRLPGRRVRGAMFPPKVTQWAGPIMALAVVGGIVALLVINLGTLDLSASKPHPRGWAQLLHYVFRRSTAAHAADLPVPTSFGTPADVAKGATYYGMACAHCHGAPGLGQNPVALSMTPRPQYLMREVSIFTDRELFWIVKHGVKYSAMPSFPVQDRDDEAWSVVSFLRQMPKMSTAQYRTLAYGDAVNPDAPGEKAVAALANRFPSGGYVLPHSDEPPADQYQYAHPALGFDAFSIDGDVVRTCSRCHTDNGTGRAGGAIPNIALLEPNYFRAALRRYASGVRHSGFMQPVATQLSDDQMTALARYYTSQPKRRSDTRAANFADPALVAQGQHIAAIGLVPRGIGACSSCHDITRASAKAFPAIDGQHLAYLRGRLLQFRGEPYPVPGGNPMIAIAKKLSPREIEAVSAYYASREPAARRPTLPAS